MIFDFWGDLTGKAVLKYALEMSGEQYVMRCGMILMLALSVHNLDCHLMVCHYEAT